MQTRRNLVTSAAAALAASVVPVAAIASPDEVTILREDFDWLLEKTRDSRSRALAPAPTITGLQYVDKAVIVEDKVVSGFWEGEMLGKHILGAAVLTYYPGWDRPMVSRIESFSGSTQEFFQAEMDRMWAHWPAHERWDLARTHGGRYAVRVYYTEIVTE